MTPPAKMSLQTVVSTLGSIIIAIVGWLAISLLGFKDEVLIGITELRVQIRQQTGEITELRKQSGSYVTQEQLTIALELQALKLQKSK